MALDKTTQREIESNVLASVRNVILIVLCAGMMGMGMVKIVGEPQLLAKFAEWGFSRWIVFAIGIFELAIAITLFIKPLRKYALISLIVLLVAAIGFHIYNDDISGAIGPFAVLNGAIALGLLDKKIG